MPSPTTIHGTRARMRRALALCIALLAALAIALPATLLPSAARAADDETTQPIEITSTSFSKKTIEATEGVQLTLGFALPNNVFHDGFTSKLQLPDGFVFYTDASFDIHSTSGDVIAHATMQRGANTMAFVYTDYVDHHSNITGTMTFSFMMDPHNEPANGPTPFDVLIDGNHVPCGTIDVVTMQGDDPNETFSKYGWQDAKTPNEIQYAMRVNGAGIDMRDITLSDTLGTPGMAYLPQSLQVMLGDFVLDDEGHYQLDNQQDITGQCPSTFDGDRFSISLPDLDGKGVFVLYKVKIAYTPQNNEVFDNAAVAHYNGADHPYSWKVRWQTASGEANGYNYGIRLTKTDEDGTTKLAGATYTVTRDRSGVVVGTLTTNADGEASISGLLADDYTLTETKAPEGYELSGDDLHVTYKQFQDASLTGATVDVTAKDTKKPEPAPSEPTEPTPKPTEPTPKPTEPSPKPTEPVQPQPSVTPTPAQPSAAPTPAPAPQPSASATETVSPIAATGSNIAWICGIAAIAAVIAAILLIVAMRRRRG